MPDRTIKNLYRIALATCWRMGFPSNDPEYGSAINWAVWKATQYYRPQPGGKKLTTYACILALRACNRVDKVIFAEWRKQDLAACTRGRINSSVQTPIPLKDFEVLSFVAAHGRQRAALLLGISHAKLRDLLDEIVLRMG